MRWKLIPNFTAYEISEFGNIRRSISKTVYTCGYRKKPGQWLKPPQGIKYSRYTLRHDNGNLVKNLKVSRLVLLAFVGPRPSKKHFALHWDGNTNNNHFTNLRWGTLKENCADMERHGTTRFGCKNHAAKLNEENVLKARRIYATGETTITALAMRFGVSISVMYNALRGNTWPHVSEACTV